MGRQRTERNGIIYHLQAQQSLFHRGRQKTTAKLRSRADGAPSEEPRGPAMAMARSGQGFWFPGHMAIRILTGSVLAASLQLERRGRHWQGVGGYGGGRKGGGRTDARSYMFSRSTWWPSTVTSRLLRSRCLFCQKSRPMSCTQAAHGARQLMKVPCKGLTQATRSC